MTSSDRKPRTYADAVRDAKPKSEAEIAKAVASKLEGEGWSCFSEVRIQEFVRGIKDCPNGIADLVAVRGNLAMIVEAKMSFGLSVLEQAIEWTRVSPLVVVATASAGIGHKDGLKAHLQRYFGLGLYTVSNGYTSYRFSPRLLRHNLANVDAIRACLDDRMKLSTAGASTTFRMSPYQDMTWHLRLLLAQHGPMTMKRLIELISARDDRFHYASAASMKQQIRAAIQSYEEDLKFDQATSIVTWVPELCSKGEKYAERVKSVAQDIAARGA